MQPDVYLAIDRPVKLVDQGGRLVRWLQPDDARRAIASGEYHALGTARRVRALQWHGARQPDICERHRYPLRSRGLGDSTRRGGDGSYWNPRGCWTIAHVPASTHRIFLAVLLGCLQQR